MRPDIMTTHAAILVSNQASPGFLKTNPVASTNSRLIARTLVITLFNTWKSMWFFARSFDSQCIGPLQMNQVLQDFRYFQGQFVSARSDSFRGALVSS